ncbi:hypothetical protein KK083_20260 [Fulvivirgaceae bacterium PWU4]|uniref:Uncharacterized protein n=1 Tax=Chryseosolibacter histidini TaxID=2782349 RepID=A0AAP2DQ88_9BACT|nr:hypothetical protein [Chryseosolibacter histidini]MBT1699242.1 hypothetical protein [Chryseosolibacter histidini]
MKRRKFEYDFIVFLFAYLIQIDFSLDRSLWSSWKELQEYYRTVIPPRKVADYLQLYSNLEQVEAQDFTVKEISALKKIELSIIRLFSVNIYLSVDEVSYCIKQLLTFQEYLASRSEVDKFEIENLRAKVSLFAHNILKYKISRRDQKKCFRIEHFLSNNMLEVIKIEDFTKTLKM